MADSVGYVVGMVQVNCPGCAEFITVDVRVVSVSVGEPGYGRRTVVRFADESAMHDCVGRRDVMEVPGG